MLCTYLTVKCLYEANELNEALKVINSVDNYFSIPKGNNSTNSTPCSSTIDATLFDDTPKNVSNECLNKQPLLGHKNMLILLASIFFVFVTQRKSVGGHG